MENKNKKSKEAKIKAIIFDFDDTLVNTKEESINRHRAAAEKAGLKFDEKKFLKLYGRPWPDLLEDIFGSETERFLHSLKKEGGFVNGKIEGVEGAIKKLASKNILLGILSSGTKKIVHMRLQKELRCSGLFDKNMIISKEDIKRHKPSKEALTNIISYLKTKNIGIENILYCGDLLVDFEFARNAGVSFIAATASQHTKKELINAGLGKRMVVPSVKILPEKLEELDLL